MARTEFRVVVKREGMQQKARVYRTMRGAQRRLALYGPEPWLVMGHAAEDLFCCDDCACSCGGITWRQRSDEHRASMPKLEFARIEARKVGAWKPTGTGCPKCGSDRIKDKGTFDKCRNCGARFADYGPEDGGMEVWSVS